MPSRRHRPPAGHPRHEAVPRGVARGLGHPRRHAPDHAASRAGRGGGRRPGRPRRRARARGQGLPVHGLRQPALRRRHDAGRRPRLPAAARGDRDGRPPGRAAGREVRVRHHHRHRHHVRRAAAGLRRDRDHGRGDEPGLPRRPGRRPRRGPVRRRLHEEGQPRPGADGRPQRRRHRRRLHGHGLLAHEPPLRRRERDHRLPPDAVRAGGRRGGAGRDRARGRPDGVPRQPDRADRRGRAPHRGQVHPQQAGRARRLRPPLAGADRGLRVHRPGRHRDPGRVAGGRPLVPAGRGQLRGQPRPAQGGSRDLRDERPRRVRLRRLRDRARRR